MASQRFDPVDQVVSSFAVLLGNILLVVPNAVATLVPALVFFAFGGAALIRPFFSPAMFENPGAMDNLFTPSLIIGLGTSVVVFLLLSWLATGATYGGCADVLSGRPIGLASLLSGGFKNAGRIFVYGLIIFVAAIVAELVVGLLAVITHGIGMILMIPLGIAALVAAFMLIYGLPALIAGGVDALDAMGDSADIARENVGATFTLILALIAVSVVSQIFSSILAFIPGLGLLVGVALQALCSTYTALATTRFYLGLSRPSARPPA